MKILEIDFTSEQASETLTPLNVERPTIWDEISNWIDRNGAIANADLCRIAEVDTLKASKMLKAFVEEGILEPLPGRAKRNAAYVKPNRPQPQQVLLPDADDN